jgi:hypothetical protein
MGYEEDWWKESWIETQFTTEEPIITKELSKVQKYQIYTLPQKTSYTVWPTLSVVKWTINKEDCRNPIKGGSIREDCTKNTYRAVKLHKKLW